MPNFFTIQDGWNVDEQLADMLRDLDSRTETDRTTEFQNQLKVLMQEYCISDDTLSEWVEQGILIPPWDL